MENQISYKTEFKGTVQICKNSKLYLGTGNPNAKVLILGKECAIDVESKECEAASQDIREIKDNIPDWESNITNQVQFEHIKDWPRNNYNPLYPYMGQANTISKKGRNIGTSSTWFNYQKLANEIFGKSPESGDTISFHKHFFLSELSELARKTSARNNSETKSSIEKRLHLFSSSDFFKNIPIIILACGNYIDQQKLEDTFQVNFKERRGTKPGQFFWLHYNEEGTKLVIHTRQFSNGISNDLIKEIAQVCKKFITLF